MSQPLPAQEAGEQDESEVAAHMHEHLTRITTIKASIIMDELDGVREPATWLAEHESVAGLPANYEPYVELMRMYARQVVAAPDLKSAADSVSKMARNCGNCHLTNAVELEFGFDTRPAEWADTVTHMQRHQWAADRLWEGLIGPSDIAWNRGTDMLVDVPLHPADVMDASTNGTDTDVIDKIAHRVHLLGGQGTNVRTPDARSELYAELLGLCADCHSRVGGGPAK
jgi:cytochrome c553